MRQENKPHRYNHAPHVHGIAYLGKKLGFITTLLLGILSAQNAKAQTITDDPDYINTPMTTTPNYHTVDTLSLEGQKEINKMKQEIVANINNHRKKQGLSPLSYSKLYEKIAQEYATYCVKNNWTEGHYDKEGNNSKARAQKHGYTGTVRENLYFSGKGPKDIVQDWITHSPSHTKNLESPTSKEIAIGITQFSTGGFAYVVMMFD